MMMILKAKNPHFLLQSTKPPNDKTHSNKHKRKSIPSVTKCQCLLRNFDVGKLVHEFNPEVPVEKVVIPPSSWYTDPSFFQEELERVFYRGWQAVGCIEHIKDPGDFFTGRLGDVEFLVYLFIFWVCILIAEFVFLLFLFKIHLDLNSCDFWFLILFLIFFFLNLDVDVVFFNAK